jgi:hypothetical protein
MWEPATLKMEINALKTAQGSGNRKRNERSLKILQLTQAETLRGYYGHKGKTSTH